MGTDNTMESVRVSGRSIANSWWVKAWNRNLENYSDYSNRLPRGRRYEDLRGEVRAKVQGSSRRPYSVDVGIRSMSEGRKESIARGCAGKV